MTPIWNKQKNLLGDFEFLLKYNYFLLFKWMNPANYQICAILLEFNIFSHIFQIV